MALDTASSTLPAGRLCVKIHCSWAAAFIVTDPVSGATTPLGRLIFGLLVGVLTVLIRVFGGFPDAVAFAVLIMNIAVPFIDQYTQPRVFGHKGGNRA